ncbi:secretin N-terminal domain-containing protein [Aquincola sp. MAHUQ-54]|uniref:Secretin N-terminal domain-containing protein n=1 Tax=Aquincola agrisoli TaxID=3119538 RepID=A0AAW9Q4J9_9BURK
MRQASPPAFRPTLASLAAALLLAACATNTDLKSGQRLLSEGRIEEGLAQLEAAAMSQPRRPEAYNLYITQRDGIVNAMVRDGDSLRLAGELDGAEARYRSALRFDANSVTAQSGIDAVHRMRRLNGVALDAQQALARGDAEQADRLARRVLAEDSTHRAARAIVRSVAEQKQKHEAAEPQLKAAMSRQISLELREAPLRSVFEIVSRTGGINFVLDREVKGDQKTTIFVRDSSLEDTIKILLLTNQLERKVLNDNTILIYPATQAKQREYQELSMRTFYLANADAKQTAAMIRAMVKTRDIFIDEKLNLVIMRDTPEAIRLAEQLVATQDLGEPEVMLELEVLEVASSLVEEFGVRYPDQIVGGVPSGSSSDGSPTFSALTRLGSGSGPLRAYVANPVLLLNLKKQDGSTNILANPRIRVKNREKAKVHIGERVPVITSTATPDIGISSSVNYLETGLKLDVEPNIYLEDEVAIKVQLEVSTILEQLNLQNTVSYRLGTRTAATTLRLRDGETQVLAGLINSEDRKNFAKVPYLGDMPVLGQLFRNNDERGNKSEIVLLVTPRVVRNLARPDAVASQFASGTEASPGVAPLRLGSAVAPRFVLEAGGGAPLSSSAATAPPPVPGVAPQPLALSFQAPPEAAPGQEFSVSLSLPASNAGGVAQVELQYDTAVLAVVGGNPDEPGRMRVDVAAPAVAGMPPAPVHVRFRVVSKVATQTQINIDASGSRQPVLAPGAATLNVVPR